MNNISDSSMKTYQRCPRQFLFNYEMRLRKIEKANHRADLGVLISQVMETYYTQGGDPLQLFYKYYGFSKEETFKKLPEITKTAENYWKSIDREGQRALAGYHEFAQANDNFKVVSAEEKMYAPISDEWQFSFIPDLVVEQDGRIVIVDHKLRADLKLLEYRLGIQLKLYSAAVRDLMHLDYLPDIVYNVITDKDGKVAYNRISMAVSENMIKYPLLAIENTIKHIEESRESGVWIPQYMWDCTSRNCDVNDLCVALENGDDIDYLVEELYERR